MANKELVARQIHRALQFFSQGFAAGADDSTIMEIADLYPDWKADVRYSVGTIVKYGANNDGETQLYRVAQEHTSQDDWHPDGTPALYTAIGFTSDGVPIWTRPLGAHDAYNAGDRVSFEGAVYESLQDGNIWSPSEHPSAWAAVSE